MSKPSGSNTKPPFWRWETILPPAIFLGVAGFSLLGAFEGLDRMVSDQLVTWKVTSATLPLSPRIQPVDLNDSAERNLGDQVDNRQSFADLFRVMGEGNLSGAMDFLFTGKKDPAIDKAMADSAGRMSNLVLAVVPVSETLSAFTGNKLDPEDAAILRTHLWHPLVSEPGTIPRATTFLVPNRELLRRASRLGHIGVTPDNDGLYRKTPLFYRWEDGCFPCLSLALAVDELKIDLAKVEIHPGSEVVLPRMNGPAIRIPIDNSGFAWIPYPSTWNHGVKRIPLDKVVNGSKTDQGTDRLIQELGDGIIIAADLTAGHKDFGTTPFEPVYPLSGIHTSLLNGIMTNTFYRSEAPWLQGSWAVFLLLGVFLTAGFRNELGVHLGFAGLLAALVVGSGLFWFEGLVLPWFVGPALGLAAGWAAAVALRLYQSHEKRLLLENALTRYFPRALAARVLNEKRTDLKPASKGLTILFSDISGFTKWSSDKAPELVHGFLSDYLESMATIIFEHGGTVDKFMGDGILAFFGDPLDQPDHAQRCLRAALAMQAKVAELREVWGPKAAIDLKVRIGVNTGPVIVGNLGSRTRIEYTVIGASVNLAQRMEGNAPLGGILVAGATWALTKDMFRFGETRAVAAKGYDEPMEAYVLGGEKD